MSFREISLRRDPACPLCGDAPVITELMDYEHFCATGETRPDRSSTDGIRPGSPATAASTGKDISVAGTLSAPEVPQLGPLELRDMLSSGEPPFLLDVREPWEWTVSNLESHGARHIPLDLLPTRLHELPQERGVVVYCRSGARSDRAARLLLGSGLFPVWNLAEGLEGWARRVDPDLPVA